MQIYPGMSIRTRRVPADKPGSLGALLRREGEEAVNYALTCAHVVTPTTESPIENEDIIDDAGVVIGKLVNWTLRDPSRYQRSDTALIRLVEGPERIMAIKRKAPVTGYSKFLYAGMNVDLMGQNDDALVSAKITNVQMPAMRLRVREREFRFRNVVSCQATDASFGDASDSGSVVLNRRGRAVGMLYAGLSETSTRFFCAMSVVLDDVFRMTGERFHVAGISNATAATPVGEMGEDPNEIITATRDRTPLADPLSGAAIDVIARTLWAEARGEFLRLGARAYEAVAEVIFNRAQRFAEKRGEQLGAGHLIAVCKEPWQFSCWNPEIPDYRGGPDANYQRMVAVGDDDAQYRAARDIASQFMSGSRSTNHVKGAMFYYNPAVVDPPWAREITWSVDIGAHRFARGPRHNTYGPA